MTARSMLDSTMDREARQGFSSALCCFAPAVGWALALPWSYLLVGRIGTGAGFRDAAELRRHTEGSGVRHPFAARGGMKLFGTTVAGAIRRFGRRMGP